MRAEAAACEIARGGTCAAVSFFPLEQAMSSPDVSTLLQRYRPVIQYDSHESFYADSVAIMTDRVTPGSGQAQRCNTLKNAAGKVIASAKPSAGQTQLNLGFLSRQYAIGAAAT